MPKNPKWISTKNVFFFLIQIAIQAIWIKEVKYNNLNDLITTAHYYLHTLHHTVFGLFQTLAKTKYWDIFYKKGSYIYIFAIESTGLKIFLCYLGTNDVTQFVMTIIDDMKIIQRMFICQTPFPAIKMPFNFYTNKGLCTNNLYNLFCC